MKITRKTLKYVGKASLLAKEAAQNWDRLANNILSQSENIERKINSDPAYQQSRQLAGDIQALYRPLVQELNKLSNLERPPVIKKRGFSPRGGSFMDIQQQYNFLQSWSLKIASRLSGYEKSLITKLSNPSISQRDIETVLYQEGSPYFIATQFLHHLEHYWKLIKNEMHLLQNRSSRSINSIKNRQGFDDTLNALYKVQQKGDALVNSIRRKANPAYMHSSDFKRDMQAYMNIYKEGLRAIDSMVRHKTGDDRIDQAVARYFNNFSINEITRYRDAWLRDANSIDPDAKDKDTWNMIDRIVRNMDNQITFDAAIQEIIDLSSHVRNRQRRDYYRSLSNVKRGRYRKRNDKRINDLKVMVSNFKKTLNDVTRRVNNINTNAQRDKSYLAGENLRRDIFDTIGVAHGGLNNILNNSKLYHLDDNSYGRDHVALDIDDAIRFYMEDTSKGNVDRFIAKTRNSHDSGKLSMRDFSNELYELLFDRIEYIYTALLRSEQEVRNEEAEAQNLYDRMHGKTSGR